MIEIIEILNAPETQQLYYRCGDRFSATYSVTKKRSEVELYGEGYFYRAIMKEFGIPEIESIRVVSVLGELLFEA
ncbi:MAG: hypothetical protein R3A80_08805 [Bdellovibrionota bacterium]